MESEIIQAMPALEHFSHTFLESEQPDAALAARADVILANLKAPDAAEALRALTAAKRADAELILLADKAVTALVADSLDEADDLWTTPMSEQELRFRFLRWQQHFKRIKDAWQTSHYLESTINNIPNLVWYKDKNGIHEKVNDSFCKAVNKTKQQVEGRGHAYIWNVEHDDPACIESDNATMRMRETCVSEESIRTGQETRLLTTYKSPLYDLDGSVMGTVGVAIDITKERAYERELIEKSRSLESIFTTMDCGILCHSLDGARILSINRAALQILGYASAEEMLADGFDMMATSVVEEDRSKLLKDIQQLKEPGDSISVGYKVRHRDGTLLHVMGNVKLMEENGERFYQRFLLDCTTQKLHEEQVLAEIERHQMELIHALCTDYYFVCLFDLDTGVGSVLRDADGSNSAFSSIFHGELHYEECIDAYIQQFVHEDDRELLRQNIARNRLKEEFVHRETRYINFRIHVGDQLHHYQIKAVRAGTWPEHKGIVLGFHSIDDEIHAEIKQKLLLEDALSQANRANKAKSTFLLNMSHDIRTPMNAILSFAHLAATHIDQRDRVAEYLKKILASGNHLVSLINDILDMSHIESGKIQLEEALFSLPEILHSLTSIIQSDIHVRRLNLHIHTVDVVDEEIYCDKLRLNQVLLNLLSNAIKYTGAGGSIFLQVAEKPCGRDGCANFEFRARDTGIGMSEEFLPHIFDAFERERNSTISGIQGTGLGMTITKNIVDMMNGSIEVHSKQHVGTEFVVTLPFRLHESSEKSLSIPALGGCRALVADGDSATCDSLSRMLTQCGLRAEWTQAGQEAVMRARHAAACGDGYGVYVIDGLIPDMDSLDVVREIRAGADGKAPLIILTAYDWTDIEDDARKAGVTAFLSKPLFPSELCGCLRSLVETAEADASGADKAAGHVRAGRILLAEDNLLNQEIAATILEEAGFSVEIADNGQIAVDMLARSEPGYYQLILMDIQMPVMDGYTAASTIRALDDPDLASIPILAMTANAFEEDRQQALRHGMNGHISKPIDVDVLFRSIDSFLK